MEHPQNYKMQSGAGVLFCCIAFLVEKRCLAQAQGTLNLNQVAKDRSEATSNLLGSAQKVGIAQRSAVEPMLITCDIYMKII